MFHTTKQKTNFTIIQLEFSTKNQMCVGQSLIEAQLEDALKFTGRLNEDVAFSVRELVNKIPKYALLENGNGEGFTYFERKNYTYSIDSFNGLFLYSVRLFSIYSMESLCLDSK